MWTGSGGGGDGDWPGSSDGWAGHGDGHLPQSIDSFRINDEFTVVVEGNNGAGFGWYFSNWETFGGIFLKIGSFNGMDPILP